MAFIATKTSWGIACTISAATAAANSVEVAGTPVRIVSIVAGGAATTDIITVTDAAGNKIFVGSALVGNSTNVNFATPVIADGLKVGFAGATTGWCSIVYDTK